MNKAVEILHDALDNDSQKVAITMEHIIDKYPNNIYIRNLKLNILMSMKILYQRKHKKKKGILSVLQNDNIFWRVASLII